MINNKNIANSDPNLIIELPCCKAQLPQAELLEWLKDSNECPGCAKTFTPESLEAMGFKEKAQRMLNKNLLALFQHADTMEEPDITEVETLVQRGANINTRDEEFNFPLRMALQLKFSTDFIKKMLALGAKKEDLTAPELTKLASM